MSKLKYKQNQWTVARTRSSGAGSDVVLLRHMDTVSLQDAHHEVISLNDLHNDFYFWVVPAPRFGQAEPLAQQRSMKEFEAARNARILTQMCFGIWLEHKHGERWAPNIMDFKHFKFSEVEKQADLVWAPCFYLDEVQALAVLVELTRLRRSGIKVLSVRNYEVEPLQLA